MKPVFAIVKNMHCGRNQSLFQRPTCDGEFYVLQMYILDGGWSVVMNFAIGSTTLSCTITAPNSTRGTPVTVNAKSKYGRTTHLLWLFGQFKGTMFYDDLDNRSKPFTHRKASRHRTWRGNIMQKTKHCMAFVFKDLLYRRRNVRKALLGNVLS